jgi:hypothetical protein
VATVDLRDERDDSRLGLDYVPFIVIGHRGRYVSQEHRARLPQFGTREQMAQHP